MFPCFLCIKIALGDPNLPGMDVIRCVLQAEIKKTFWRKILSLFSVSVSVSVCFFLFFSSPRNTMISMFHFLYLHSFHWSLKDEDDLVLAQMVVRY